MRRRLGPGAVSAALAVLAAVAALVDPWFQRPPRPTVIVLDRSASVDGAMRSTESRWVSRAVADDACRRPCSVVTFAGNAVRAPAAVASTAAGDVSAAGDVTDLTRGVQAAVASAPSGSRVLVLSDGMQTATTVAAVSEAAARGITIDGVLLRDGARRDAAVTRLDAPTVVHQGDTVSLLVTVRSTTISPATLIVNHDGIRTTQVVQLHDGDNNYTLSYTAAGQGWHSFGVAVALAGDQLPQNDRRSASVDVGAPPQVLVVSQGTHSLIAQLLAARGADVTSTGPADVPVAASRYDGVDALVLDDVPARALTAAQTAALDEAVREGGLGLLVLGGPHAFSLGRYASSSLERMLPVSSLVPGSLQRRNEALELVLDRSGSMSDLAGGVKKITMVQAAAREVAQFAAKHRDQLGIVDFDIVPHTLLSIRRLQPGTTEHHVVSLIDGLQADGGTDVYLGLRTGLRQLLKSSTKDRHLILLTDGISQAHNYTPLLAQLARNHIAVATVALGADADSELLRRIAAATGGNAYITSNAHELPKIFAKETRLNAKPVETHGRQQVVALGSSPVVRSLAGRRLPELTGNVVTRLRPGAEADLLARRGKITADPALAQWSYGLGRVVAWTPGLGPPWASSWSAESSLWNDAARWVARAVPPPRIDAFAQEGSTTRIELDLSSQAPTAVTTISGAISVRGRLRALRFAESAPATYTASLGQLPEGSYELTLDLAAALGGPQRRPVDIPYPAEFLPTPGQLAALGQLVAPTGGRLFDDQDPGAAFPGRGSLRRGLIAASALLFLLSVFARLLGRVRIPSARRASST
jgi:Ca-activated chloride channel homolog